MILDDHISANKFLMSFVSKCRRRLLLKAQIAQGSLRGPLFNPPEDNVLGPLKRPPDQAQRTLNLFGDRYTLTNLIVPFVANSQRRRGQNCSRKIQRS